MGNSDMFDRKITMFYMLNVFNIYIMRQRQKPPKTEGKRDEKLILILYLTHYNNNNIWSDF